MLEMNISFRFYHTKINRKKMLVVKVDCVVITRSTFFAFFLMMKIFSFSYVSFLKEIV